MNLNPSPSDLSRFGGCTLTGALSVTTHVRDAMSIVHGPKGCTHHNFSLLHATGLDNDRVTIPDLVSTGLSESDIVFGGEEALFRTIESVAGRDVQAIFVLSTCIVDTIGDDVGAVCCRDYGVPVIPVPTAGFLGGTFQNGVNNALIALAGTAEPCTKNMYVNVIGEKNLEYEVEENYAELVRLLSMLGIAVNMRFVHNLAFDQINSLGAAQLNILRDTSLTPVGEYLQQRFGTPFIASFPFGLSGTLSFIGNVADACGMNGQRAIDEERALQEEIIADFSDLYGSPATFDNTHTDSDGARTAREAAQELRMNIGKSGCGPVLPVTPSVGTAGVRRMFHRWRRAVHA